MYDVKLNSNGDLPAITDHITGIDSLQQRLRIKMNTWAGEWFLDQRRGLPYIAWKQQKPPDLSVIRSRILREIRTTPGVNRVRDLSINFERGKITVNCLLGVDFEDNLIGAEMSALPGGNAQPAQVLIF